jgi:hypothetical protein
MVSVISMGFCMEGAKQEEDEEGFVKVAGKTQVRRGRLSRFDRGFWAGTCARGLGPHPTSH